MVIRLTVENIDRLPNGGPIRFEASGDSFVIGREGQDWNLPDPDMFISGRHCQIRYDNGSYWLHDVSRNGTFVNGSAQRVSAPHRLESGDKLKIGRYIVSVAVAAGAPLQAPSGQRSSVQPFGAGDSIAGQAAVRPTPPHPRESSFSFEDDAFLKSSRPVDLPASDRASPAVHHPQLSGIAHTSPSGSPALSTNEFVRALAEGAGVSPLVFDRPDEREIAFEIGVLLKTVVEEIASLLKARAAAKVLAKSSHRTMIGAADNNPLKFLPTSEEILEVMFARRRAGYMDAKRSLEDAFKDLKTHEIATYAAMQAALGRLLDDFAPETIEKKLPVSTFSSKKTRAWEAFVTAWETKEAAHENGMLDVFLAYFSEAYAKAVRPK